MGRRLPTARGSIVIMIGAKFFTNSLAMFVGGRIVRGVGSYMIHVRAPVLMTKLSRPKERVQLIIFYKTSISLSWVANVGFVRT